MSRACSTAIAALVASLALACTAAQSARVLAPGKTQLTVAAARSSASSGEGDDHMWHGAVMLRQGLSPHVDGGLFLQRSPGAGGLSFAGVEPKVQLTGPGPGAVSIALAAGPYWADGSDGDGLDGEYGGLAVVPTLFLGYDLSPTVELVLAPKLFVFLPHEANDDNDVQGGGSLGLRFTDRARTWAVHPELAFMTTDGENVVTLGVSVAAGN